MKWWHTVYESVCERERKGEGDGCVIIREEGEGQRGWRGYSKKKGRELWDGMEWEGEW